MSEKKSKYDKMLEKIKFKADIPQNPKSSFSFDVEPPCFFVAGIDNSSPRVESHSSLDQESQSDSMTPNYQMPSILLPTTKSYHFSSNKGHNEFYDMSPKNSNLAEQNKNAGYNLSRIEKYNLDQQKDRSFDLKQQQPPQKQDILTPKRHLRILTDPSDNFKGVSSFMSPIHSKSPRLSSIHHSSPSKPLTMSLRLRAKQFLLNQQSNSNLEESLLENPETQLPSINQEQNQKTNISNKLPSINVTTPKRICVSLPKSKINHSYLSNQQSEKQQSNTLFGYHFDFVQEDLSPKRKNERRALQNIEKLFVQSKSIQIGKAEKIIMGNSEYTRLSTDIKIFQEQQKDEQNKQTFMNFMDKNKESSQNDIALISSYPTKSNLEELRCDLEKKQVDVEFEASQRSIKKLKKINVVLKQKTKIERDFPIQEMPQCLKVKSNNKL